MTEIRDACENLLKECHNNISTEGSLLRSNTMPKVQRKRIDIEQRKFGISPQEMEDNAKIIDKLRKKYHKKTKEATIKKTNLGEDLLTFTS
jgi:hypothetical protein